MHLISLPPNVVPHFHELSCLSSHDWFCTNDPVGHKLGSGGGTAWLLAACHAAQRPEKPFEEWLREESRVLIHAGGQSRRLPAYAPSGKALLPMPVFRWESGQCIDQTLLDTQMPLYRRVLSKAAGEPRTLIASGDVFLRATDPLQDIPADADVVCYGLWGDAHTAEHHGVFLIRRDGHGALDFMLQKPSVEAQRKYVATHYQLLDIGLWLLSPRAVERLMRKSVRPGGSPTQATDMLCYDLYSQFGCALGTNPSKPDADLADLKTVVLPLPGGEFYHFGTAPELLESSVALQNLVRDQRLIIQQHLKPHPSLFVQNAVLERPFDSSNKYVWVENAHVGSKWTLTRHNIVTGVPHGDWALSLPEGVCLDVVPVGDAAYALRPYGYNDAFRGGLEADFLGAPFGKWLAERGISATDIVGSDDLQTASLFPVLADLTELPKWFAYMTASPDIALRADYLALPRLSAEALSAQANLPRLFAQRRAFLRENLSTLSRNWQKSVFYQTNLADLAAKYHEEQLHLPPPLPTNAPLMTRIHDAMFRSETMRLQGSTEAAAYSKEAFTLLAEGLTNEVRRKPVDPRLDVYADQIVWGRSPVRIDLAGGWTDTPPYSLTRGGSVINLAINLNGQQPLQVYVKPCKELVVICRSIDLGATERLETYEDLAQFNRVGSPFSIPKAALALCGFLPGFGVEEFPSLRAQLESFGAGIEITLLSAIPAGSGLGTSSILAATVLGALSDFCALGWDSTEVCRRVLVLEQLLTTGGGWQDQYDGVLPGLKLLQTDTGFGQVPLTHYLPDTIFTAPELSSCHLLYYTGLTRTAKQILAEIVRGMFLNSTAHLQLLGEMKTHTLRMYEALQRLDFDSYGCLLRRTWEQNKRLDAGTSPIAITKLCTMIDDLCLGYKLPGAGGGGYLYMVAKDADAAKRIRRLLAENPPAPGARFVGMGVSQTGFQVSRS